MTDVLLPMNFQMNAISKFASQIVSLDGNPVSKEIAFDFSKLNFIDGSGYTVLSNAIEWLLANDVHVRIKNFERRDNHAIQYLDDCGFFYKYVKQRLRSDAKTRDSTLPCAYIEHSHGFSWVENKLSPWLEWKLRKSKGQMASIRTCVKEVLNNIADHSSVNTGFVHAQHYPTVNSIKITTSDFGRGIPNTIRSRYGAMTDTDAIKLAVQNGVTSQSRPNNMGAGLSYLVDTVVANRGIVRFHSLTGNLTCLCDNRGDLIQQARKGTGLYPGALIEIELDTRLFFGDEDDRTDFEW